MRGREKKGRPTRFKNRGEAGVGIAGFIKLEKPALVTPVLSFFKLMKLSLVTPVLGFKKKRRNRRWERRFQLFLKHTHYFGDFFHFRC